MFKLKPDSKLKVYCMKRLFFYHRADRMARHGLICLAQIKDLPGAVPLPGTRLLEMKEDLSIAMQNGAHRFIERKIAEAPRTRSAQWRRRDASFVSEAQAAGNKAD